MDETALMQTPQRRGYTNTNPQKLLQFPWFAEEARKHLSAGILDPQPRFSVFINKL